MATKARKRGTIFFPWERGGRSLGWSALGPRLRLFVLAAVVLSAGVWLVSRADHRAKVRATRTAAATLKGAVALFRIDHGRCPRNVQELLRPPSGLPYVPTQPTDGWGRGFVLHCPGSTASPSAEVVSAGENGAFDGTDDVQ